MGAMSNQIKDERCLTCNQHHAHCPGHFGHIHLSCPVFNPTLFKYLDCILNCKCYNCHRLLFDDSIIQIIEHKLRTIDKGFIFDLSSIDSEKQKLIESKLPMNKKVFINNNLLNRIQNQMKASDISINEDINDSDDDIIMDMDFKPTKKGIPSDFNEMEMKIDSISDLYNRELSLSFLDETNMKGTRQQLLACRMKFFELKNLERL